MVINTSLEYNVFAISEMMEYERSKKRVPVDIGQTFVVFLDIRKLTSKIYLDFPWIFLKRFGYNFIFKKISIVVFLLRLFDPG